MLKVIIDGQSYVVTFAPENMVPGADYLCEVMVLNRYEPVTLTNSEKNKRARRDDNLSTCIP